MAFSKFACLLAIVAFTALAAPVARAQEEDQDIREIEALFDEWNGALATGDASKVASLYMADGVLLPTISNQVRYDDAGKVDYFKDFLKKNPQGTINEDYTRFLNPEKDVAARSGIYTFNVTNEDNTTSLVQARFTYVYAKDPATGAWKIVEHHSSVLPEKADPLDEVAALFDAWNSALATEDPQKVADMYAEESVLLPTISNTPRTDREGKVDYFTDFLKKKPVGVIDEANIRFLDADQSEAINSGIYTFTLTDEAGKESKVQARYTFVYAKDPVTGEWKIVEHHSSAMPEKVEEETPVTKAGRKML